MGELPGNDGLGNGHAAILLDDGTDRQRGTRQAYPKAPAAGMDRKSDPGYDRLGRNE